MRIELKAIGLVRTNAQKLPRHWSVSDVEGTLVIDKEYLEGLRDIEAGQRIVVIFHFHRSPAFSPEMLRQTSGQSGKEMGVFSICSPVRPNPIGMSVLEVLATRGANIDVRRLDMLDGTPILDIKPHIEDMLEEKRPGELRGRRQPALVAGPPCPRPDPDAGMLAPFVNPVIPGLCACTSWKYDAEVKKIDPTKKVVASATAPTASTYAGIVPRAKHDAPSTKSQAMAEFRRAGSAHANRGAGTRAALCRPLSPCSLSRGSRVFCRSP